MHTLDDYKALLGAVRTHTGLDMMALPPILLTFSDLLLFLFVLSTKFSVPYVLLIFPLNDT